MSFYVVAVDNMDRRERDDPTIGIILCKEKDKTIVEFALQGNHQPIGVSSYQLQSDLPANLREHLPAVDQLEMEMAIAIEEIEDEESSNPE